MRRPRSRAGGGIRNGDAAGVDRTRLVPLRRGGWRSPCCARTPEWGEHAARRFVLGGDLLLTSVEDWNSGTVLEQARAENQPDISRSCNSR